MPDPTPFRMTPLPPLSRQERKGNVAASRAGDADPHDPLPWRLVKIVVYLLTAGLIDTRG